MKARSALAIILGPESSSVCCNNCAAYRQAQPHALLMCGEEWIKNALQVLGWDATTVVP